MEIRLFFGASSSQPTDVKSSESEDENDSSKSDTESLEPSPAKKKKICAREAQEQEPTSYKQSKIQHEMGRELQLAHL